ncbi:MAG: hypothetical protein LBP53_05515 [Candidatus Peribacteria bacterium]|jgi:hypothetical protein|nr:hypothetical protein [Candidatus Peribacteria bacterium]
MGNRLKPFRDTGTGYKPSNTSFAYYPSGARYSLGGWQNVHNDVEVIFGVEGDIINEQGDVCCEIQNSKPEFILLALH